MAVDILSEDEPQMAVNLKPRSSKLKHRRRALHLEFQEYIVGIIESEWSYSLSLDSSRQRTDPYHEYRHLVIKGILLKPVEVTLLPDRNLDQERRKNHEPISVGTLELRENKIVGLIPIPMDALLPILTILMGGRFKFLAMSGTQIYRSSTRVTGFSLDMPWQQLSQLRCPTKSLALNPRHVRRKLPGNIGCPRRFVKAVFKDF